MKRVQFELSGITPLLMHADDVESADLLASWRKDPANKGLSKSGDDRSPAWTWKTYLYGDGAHICMPSDNIMTCMREAGAAVILKGKTTYKSLTQSGMMVEELNAKLLVDGKQVPMDSIDAIDDRAEFQEHEEAVRSLGFELFTKRAKIGQAKHIRVRPRFNSWSVEGTLLVVDEENLKLPVIQQIFEIGGSLKGLGDWRPSSPSKPGRFGQFKVRLKEVK